MFGQRFGMFIPREKWIGSPRSTVFTIALSFYRKFASNEGGTEWRGGFILIRFYAIITEVCDFGSSTFFCLETKEAKIQGCKEKTSLRLEFRPASMPSAAG